MKQNQLKTVCYMLSALGMSFHAAVGHAQSNELVIQENTRGFCGVDGSIDSSNSGFTGRGFVNTDNANGKAVEWSVMAPKSGNYKLKWRFANGSNSNRRANIVINGVIQANADFDSTTAWTNWSDSKLITVYLNAGDNEIRVEATTRSGLADLDYISVLGADLSAGHCEADVSLASSRSSTASEPLSSLSSASPILSQKPRVIVTTDGEIDDQCSMVRFLLYANEFDVEGIVKTSSQYHWQGHKWAGDNWEEPIYEAYAASHANLIQHDPRYPSLAFLQSITKLGNVSDEGEMTIETEGSDHIVDVLLDETDNRPIWLQAWGGSNSIARALKTIEERYPEKMDYVAKKIRLYLIWEQDDTFQSYIRDNWATPYNIPTIISDQFITFGYWWQRWNMPSKPASYFSEPWMQSHIFKSSNPLIEYYKANTKDKLKGAEAFIGEGDSPSFIHQIPTGLRSTESPDWGGWGGRYVNVRESTWLDKVPVEGYQYPSGRWYTKTGWGRQNYNKAPQAQRNEYFKPITRWIDVIQNDFAARVDWLDKPYDKANHQPVVQLAHSLNLKAKPGERLRLSAKGSFDPDGDSLIYKWWHYEEADTFDGTLLIHNSDQQDASFVVPISAVPGTSIHVVCEVKDNGSPQLTRYQRVVVEVK